MNDFVLIRKNLFRKKLRAVLMIVSILDRVRHLRRARRVRTRLRRRRGSSRTPTGWWSSTRSISPSRCRSPTPTASAASTASARPHPRQLVRRLFPGPEELPDRVRGGAGDLHGPLQRRSGFSCGGARAPSCAIAQGPWSARRWRAKWGWKVGDHIPISSQIFSQKNGARTWDFTIDGIFTSRTAARRHQLHDLPATTISTRPAPSPRT